jgi:hypothetical protein
MNVDLSQPLLLPARTASERTECGDGSPRLVGSRHCQPLCRDQPITIRIQDLQEWQHAALVGSLRLVACTGQGCKFPLDDLRLDSTLREAGEGVFDILGRSQHDAPVRREYFSVASARARDFGIYATEVEQSPA